MSPDKREMLCSHIDHTLLAQDCTWEQIETLCRDAIEYHAASVCIPPAYVRRAREYVGGRMNICTVIGFPNGYQTTASKVFETKDAIANGADEIDMVIFIGALKDRMYRDILEEIRAVKEACGEHVLKVIIEACLLTEDEKIEMCRIVTEAGADYIKTSTGFSRSGATKEDVQLLLDHVGAGVKVKAAGGISTPEDGMEFLKMGCSRLGTSKIISRFKEE